MIDLGKYGYYGDDPKPVFNTSFYRGEDLYSDGDIENEVIKIITANPTTDYEEAIKRAELIKSDFDYTKGYLTLVDVDFQLFDRA